MVKPKVPFQVFWEHRFMVKSRYVCTYYKLCRKDDNKGNTVIEEGLRELNRNCLNFINEEILLQTNASITKGTRFPVFPLT